MKISILGAGAWGTALALSLADRHEVLLWGRDAAAMAAIDRQRENRHYLPGFTLPVTVRPTADLEAAMAHAGLLIIATPVAGLRGLCTRLLPLLQLPHPPHLPLPHLPRQPVAAAPGILTLCKGFEEGSSLLPHQILRAVLGPTFAAGVLSGPSFAQEVARALPCALTVASSDPHLCEQVVVALHSPTLRIYSTDDVTGVEVGGAVKNILAIATGIIDGLGLGANARAALITRGLAEITRLGVALGGRSETFMGLTGVGDLLLTCTGDLSRNRRVGLGLAQGKPLTAIIDELGHVAEGVRCAEAVRALAHARGIDMPISAAVAGVLFDGDSARVMVTRLLSRDPRAESA